MKLGIKCPKCKGSGLSDKREDKWVEELGNYLSFRLPCPKCKGLGVKP